MSLDASHLNNSPHPSIAILILAAGSSSRMGQSKQLLKVEGEPLLVKVVKAALQADGSPVVVVLGANEPAHRQALRHLPVSIVSNPEWAKGMGSSIKVGLQYLISQGSAVDGVLMMVCDQPMVTAAYLKFVISKFQKAHIVASQYAHTLGVPALFSKEYFPELLQLKDDEGAKKIIQKNFHAIITLPFPEGAIDLDTPGDYRNFIA